MLKRKLLVFLLFCCLIFSASFTFNLQLAYGMPPHPDLLQKIGNGEIKPPDFLVNQAKYRAEGIEAPSLHPKSSVYPSGTGPTGSFRALVILVQFSDRVPHTSAGFFDTLIFENWTGTVRNFYQEVSYGRLDIIALDLPSSLGWYTAPHTYAYYCNNQYGMGSYPQNSQGLTEDVVDLADPYVDFSQYDNDGDGFVDALFIVHAGRGAEFTGNTTDIWSHKWSIAPRLKDGVYIHDYSIEPELWQYSYDMTCGVYCHELGHVFGLPDLYDYGYDSEGLGNWSLMAGGSWNGSLGNSPAHPDAFCITKLGFADPVNVTVDLDSALIPAIEDTGVIYRLWTNGSTGSQYFLVENRQKIKYDAALPGAGLMIWHVDENVDGNDNQWYPGHTSSGHYEVALEQADGLWQLEKDINSGNTGDPYPGSMNKKEFTPCTTPNSNSYSFTDTRVAVLNISNSSTWMSADFRVSSANTPPANFSLVTPGDFDTTFFPLNLDWNDSPDPDLCDSVLYSLFYSEGGSFLPESTYLISGVPQSSYSFSSGTLLRYQIFYWKVLAYDPHGGQKWSDQTRTFQVGLRGDANSDRAVNVTDIIYLIGYLYKGGHLPLPLQSGDVNCDTKVNVSDVIYLVNYQFKGGPAPCDN
ncbi:MAG TPA: M6 family metalloprotease domain-containing protein [Terriglobales bacterium]|nr:M6 family metalloprotease domain-containing protein [Terriglobales bacterium]